MTVRIQCVDIVKRYGPTPALEGVNWTVDPGTIIGLLGESGAGKTTLLRIIAGLEDPCKGAVSLTLPDGNRPMSRPKIGMVFQDLALWPHLTARQHLQCVLTSFPRRQRRQRAEAVLAETRLPTSAWGRRPGQLSGGESQRLALARALAPQPELLLDEPLARVDTSLKEELLDLIERVISDRGMTAVYVTHHWQEAIRFCQRITVMRDGQIVTEGQAEDVFFHPPSAEVARLAGPVVQLPSQWLEEGHVACAPDVHLVRFSAPEKASWLAVRPQQLRLANPVGCNRWEPAECRHSRRQIPGRRTGNRRRLKG
jgi:ABC-type Fe3+/spermidine/putrescine transport system ATPase subunit